MIDILRANLAKYQYFSMRPGLFIILVLCPKNVQNALKQPYNHLVLVIFVRLLEFEVNPPK